MLQLSALHLEILKELALNKQMVSNITLFKSNILIGVIGGTSFDSKLGVEFLNKKKIKTISANISDNPFDQTMLQLHSELLTNKVKNKIYELMEHGCNSIFIYCNSLSGAIDLDSLHSYFDLPIFTPLETYSLISNQHNSIGLIAANCQALGNLEKVILKTNPRVIITGFSSLLIVDSIEKGLSPQEIINKYDLITFTKMLKNYKINLMMLGCTHFSYFYNELTQLLVDSQINMQLFDPSEAMFKNLVDYQQKVLTQKTLAHG